MSTDQNKEIFKRLIYAINSGDPTRLRDVVHGLVADDYVGHAPGAPDIYGPDGYLEDESVFHSAFPDLQIEILDLIAEDDRVVVHFVFRGTHEGELAGVPPTGRHMTVQAVSISRVKNGKIVEEYSFVDNLDLLRQLGVEIQP